MWFASFLLDLPGFAALFMFYFLAIRLLTYILVRASRLRALIVPRNFGSEGFRLHHCLHGQYSSLEEKSAYVVFANVLILKVGRHRRIFIPHLDGVQHELDTA